MVDLQGDHSLFRQLWGTLKGRTFRQVIWGVLFFLAAALVVGSNFLSGGFSFKEGQVCPTNIYATRTIVYVDEEETERLRNEAANRVEKSYQEDADALQRQHGLVNNTFDKIRELRDAELPPEDKLKQLRSFLTQEIGISVSDLDDISDNALTAMLAASDQELGNAQSLSRNLIQEELRYGLKADGLNSARDNLAYKVTISDIPDQWEPVVSTVLVHILEPNLIFDNETYERRIQQARAEVPEVVRTYQAGQVIVREGDIITKVDLAVLRQLGLMQGRALGTRLIGVLLFVLVLGGLILFYLARFRRDILKSDQHLTLYGLVFTLTILVAKAVSVINISPQAEIGSLVGYLLPVAGGAVLITVLFDRGLAVFTSFLFSIIVGMITDGQFSFALVAFAGCMAGIFGIGAFATRSDLLRGGLFYISLANMGMILILGLLNETAPGLVLAGMGMGLLNGITSSILALGLLPYLESAFGITSTVRLLELSNPSQPLLKRLLLEAPGTYHHSILVGNLAEAAAEAVNADPLLVRVGSYYHDIGKLKRPFFFIENQISRENPHDKIAPSLSTLIITSHVKDGLELAREHKLPPDIQGIIEQHHGTSLVAYFYQKALESDRPELVTEEEFRYDSVKPQTREAALVMLADSVEAAIRSLQKPTPGRLEGLTRKIIKDKLHDGQLEECDLTFKDLNKIASAFVRVLGGIFHSRIEYPEAALITELERRKSRGAVANQ
ncbi:MAG: HD family phosphohydrolase [Thermacetogeniaceae bacterium]|jgi:putative nucleotidyltransferase with HDIG domain|nr:HDIG domain-containing protein [Thermoanaerobacterales bacterium]NLN21553.1 HDIG domain-containing protein [Syntrophomonadaceae bacterium]